MEALTRRAAGDHRLDAEVQDSFPASDSPSYTGIAGIGRPQFDGMRPRLETLRMAHGLRVAGADPRLFE